ncbi:MAG TPA: SGNH/GDSL hydrolase family protein [Candidatus Acidoferrales bacterium]|nr:SGNH/GDSL hydrolase family protein [Candidatus Acidoferrales bacterium]
MKKFLRFAPVIVLASLLAGCQGPCEKLKSITAPVTSVTVPSGTADFTTYMAVGTSISAGYQSGGLVDRHQIHSFPAIFAEQIGKTVRQNGQGSFTFPAIGGDGIPALLALKSISPLEIDNLGRTLGSPENLFQGASYHNLGIPGALAFDFSDTTNYYSYNAPLYRTDTTYFELIARGHGSIAEQVLGMSPTFLSVEYGANEVLGSATSGGVTPIFPVINYQTIMTLMMNTLHVAMPNTKFALFNVPSVTSIPYCTTFKPYTVRLANQSFVPLIGPDGSLSFSSLVLLSAADSLAVGTGFPVGSYNYVNPAAPGNGRPLTNAQVLDDAEQAAITTATNQMNATLSTLASQPWVVKVDINSLLSQLGTNGYSFGGVDYTTAFVTGGLFSLDGVHPTDLGHAIIANAMIDAVNAKFGSAIPEANPAAHITATASGARPESGPQGLPGAMRLRGIGTGLDALFPARH